MKVVRIHKWICNECPDAKPCILTYEFADEPINPSLCPFGMRLNSSQPIKWKKVKA